MSILTPIVNLVKVPSDLMKNIIHDYLPIAQKRPRCGGGHMHLKSSDSYKGLHIIPFTHGLDSQGL